MLINGAHASVYLVFYFAVLYPITVFIAFFKASVLNLFYFIKDLSLLFFSQHRTMVTELFGSDKKPGYQGESKVKAERYTELVEKLNRKLWTYARDNSEKALLRWNPPLNPNVKDLNGTTMLHLATWHNNKDLADFLVNKRESIVDSQDNIGATPLHAAAIFNSSDVAGVLIAGKADLNTKIREPTNYKPTTGNYSKYIREVSIN